MARVVNAGMLSMSAIRNGLLNTQTVGEIKRLNTGFVAALGDGVSSWFREQAATAFDRFAGDKVRSRFEALMRKNELFWESDTFRPLRSVGELQHAPDCMKEWLAVQPDLNRKINDQTCHGWGNTYLTHDGIGEDNHLYRVLYHGSSMELGEDSAFSEGWVNYFDEPEDGEHLDLYQSLAVIRSHETISELLEQDRDITDPLNNRW